MGSNIQNVISLLKLHHPKICNSVGHGGHKNGAEMNVVLNGKQSRSGEKKKLKSKQQQQKAKRAQSVPLNNYPDVDINSVEMSNRSTSPAASLLSNTEENRDYPAYEYLNEVDSKELLRRLQAEYTQLVL